MTGGAALAVVTGIAFFGLSSQLGYIAFATIGASLAAIFVYSISSLGRTGPTPIKLALAGAASSAAFVWLSTAILLPRTDLMRNFEFWRVGGVGGATWHELAIGAPRDP